MAVQSWIDRLTDETNPWFSATKLVDSGNYVDAFKVYLQDSSELSNQNQLCSAALSCSCAANCLLKIGDHTTAHQLYLETAIIYEKNADLIIGKSVRECLWSLQESYEHYLLAADVSKSQRVFEKYVNLVRKLNPISGEEEAMDILKLRRKNIENKTTKSQLTYLKIAAEISNATKEFLKINKDTNYQNEASSVQIENKDDKNKFDVQKNGNSILQEVKSFRKKIGIYKNKKNSQKIENEEYKQKPYSLKPDNHLRDEVQLLRHEIDNYQNNVDALKKENEEYKQKLYSLKPDTHLRDEVQLLRHEIDSYQNNVDALKKENEEYKQKPYSLKPDNQLSDERYIYY